MYFPRHSANPPSAFVFLLACLWPLSPLAAQDPPAGAPAASPAPAEAPAPEAPASPAPAAAAAVTMEVITFDTSPGKLYIPVDEVATVLGWTAMCPWPKKPELLLNNAAIPAASRRNLLDGTELIEVTALTTAGAEVNIHPSGQSATVTAGERQFVLLRAEKRVEVSLGEQRLRAWQGGRLVLETNISSGRGGRTPSGSFIAGPAKDRLHRSRLYNNAPMPWSVQINGHVFIHGFTSVPDYPASHGCIRVPLTGRNPARSFYEWVDTGTPVTVLPVPEKKKKPLIAK